ncbi:MAG: DNA methylase [Phycisphaerae bacterium]|nr:DNA methylase [Phycisphaerae bacterium]MBM90448.1 DNA methylase [Phycisphaerae bacterium]HCT44477.1 DNA methylase [Phycisphaerales bacterium]
MSTTSEASQVESFASDGGLAPHSLKDVPVLIERLFPVQKMSVESYKEQMANVGKTLTALGSYWKGRKPLILNKACILGTLLPATNDPVKDLEVFELLMGMDNDGLMRRMCAKGSIKHGDPLPRNSYHELVKKSKRPEELGDAFFEPIWDRVNTHLGTTASSFPDLIEQLGIARFGRRPIVADTFCGSGQIPFEAARLGCDVIASDLNPIACMLTWGAMNIVGGPPEERKRLASELKTLSQRVLAEVDRLGIETAELDGKLWRGKVYLYCVETRCPSTGWMVPMLPTRVVSKTHSVIAELVPDPDSQRYDILIRQGVSATELKAAAHGTVVRDALIHVVNGIEYRTQIKTLRGDFRSDEGSSGSQLRQWENRDFKPRPEDVFQERLYAIQWQEEGPNRGELAYRGVTAADLEREEAVDRYLSEHFMNWQAVGWIPDMKIEAGYNTNQPIRERGWTHWHHMFNPRQLLLLGLIRQCLSAVTFLPFAQALQCNARLSRWDNSAGGREAVKGVFDNQALNTLLNYGCRGSRYLLKEMDKTLKESSIHGSARIACGPAEAHGHDCDLYVTDPPYGDAVKYEEILEFFIAWLRKNPPPEFAEWVWDSRRALAIHGEDEGFRQGMVAAYRNMTDHMSENGLQIVMFTHQSTGIWADMANIVWASDLQVTAAWYVATETDSALRQGDNVKGTNILVLRKRCGHSKTTRDDLAWELEEEVKHQIQTLTGLNQQALGLYRDENLFEDADLQMAGYAAALRVLTQYAVIDGKQMSEEACRPRARGEKTAVDSLIDFAVEVANRCLIPQGITESHWRELEPIERFYLKMLGMEASGVSKLDNYQNFAKAFKVSDFRSVMQSAKANSSRLKSAAEFKRNDMGEGSPLHNTPLRAILYAMMELGKDADTDDVLAHLAMNVPNYYAQGTRDLIVALCQYLGTVLEPIRPDEASHARVLAQSVRNQRL